jgi:hypothetical protein
MDNIVHKIFLMLLLLVQLVVPGFAQPEAIVRTYGGLYSEDCQAILHLTDGGFLLVGSTGSIPDGNTDIYLVRVSENGDCLWSKTFGNSFSQKGMAIADDVDGNIYLTGFTSDISGYDLLIMKLNADGELIWEIIKGGLDWDFGSDIAIRNDKMVVCGSTYSYGNGGADGYVLELNTNGDIIHEYTFGYDGNDKLTDVFINENNEIFLGGSIETTDGSQFPWLLFLNPDYTVQWEEIFQSFQHGEIRDISPSDDSGILICGVFNGSETDFSSGFYLKMSMAGETIWQQQSDEYTVNSIAQGEDWIYIAGNSNLFGLGGSAAMILRMNLWGNWQNGAAFGEANDEFVNQVIVDDQNRVLMIGSSHSYSVNLLSDIYLVLFPDAELVSEYQLDVDHQDCFYLNTEDINHQEKKDIVFDHLNNSILWGFDEYALSIYSLDGKMIYNNEVYHNGIVIPFLGSGIFKAVCIKDSILSSTSIMVWPK